MHRIIIKISILLFSLLISTIDLFSDINGFEIIKQNNSSIELRYISSYLGDSLFKQSNNTLLLPKFKNAITENSINNVYPKFSSSINIITPNSDGYKLTINSISTHKIENYNLAQNPNYINEYKDNSSILNNDFYKITYLGISRNQHIAQLVVNPIKYNHLNKSIIIYDTINIRIDFDLSKVNFSSNINTFNSISAINFDMAKNWVSKNNDKKNVENSLQSEDRTIASLSNGEWAKITIEEEGIYKLDASDLQNAGIATNAVAAKTIKIFGKEGKALSELVSDGKNNKLDEQAIIVNTKIDGSIENIIFYGAATIGFEKRENTIKHYKNFYSDKNYYLITWGGTDGKRAKALENPQDEIKNKPNTYIERVFYDEDIVNPYTPGAGRDWFGRSFFSSPLPPTMLHDLDRNGTITYRIALAHKALEIGTFSIFENSNKIGELNLNSNSKYVHAERRIAKISIPASQINSDNRSILKFNYTNSQISAIGYFDFYELSYPRSFFAINNSIGFIADSSLDGVTEFIINGFNGDIYGYDISDLKNPKLLQNNSTTGGIYTFISDINKNNFKRFYISSNIRKPKIERTEILGLRDRIDDAPIVIITHPDLYESAKKFKEYRQQTLGQKVEVYLTTNIYNEYACGVPDITAIRDFLIDAYNKWNVKPEYLVLWGDGHYDYKNIATKKTNYIPVYQTYEDDLISFDEIHKAYATDDYLALIDGDDLMVDLNFGRLTIDNPDLGFWILDKIKHYETNSSDDVWRTKLIFIADDGPAQDDDYEGARHTGQSENLQENFISKKNPDLQFDKIYLVEYPITYIGSGRRKPSVTEDMITRINTSGALLLNWIGHGNPRVWAHEQILERDITIPRMRNLDKLFFLTAATCDFGRFDDPEVRSGAEEMFVSKNGGAIGVFSATRVVYSDENARLSNAFYEQLLSRDPATMKFPSLGKTINAIKQRFVSTNDRKYFLIGDPTMTLLIPDYKIKLTSINDTEITKDNKQIELKALSKVKISGEILNPLTNILDDTYNGTIVVTLRDGDLHISMQEIFQNTPRSWFNFTKLGASLNKSSYNVINGKFEAEFIIPRDISFSDSNSRLFLYSVSNDGKYGTGSYHNLRISGFDENQVVDTIPPDINIFIDGRNFQSGDYVTSNPLLIVDLFDESGINTTGLGIGHKIEAWIDDSPISIDLTEKFTSSLSDSRRGVVEDILFGLSKGEHKIKVRAWDVFNNFNISEMKFVIPDSKDGSIITDLFNYPNPFNDGTNIVFRHNANPPFDVFIDIYTINGVLIRNIQDRVNTLHTSQIYFDGLDNFNNKIANGIYFFTVKLNNENASSVGRGKLIIIRN